MLFCRIHCSITANRCHRRQRRLFIAMKQRKGVGERVAFLRCLRSHRLLALCCRGHRPRRRRNALRLRFRLVIQDPEPQSDQERREKKRTAYLQPRLLADAGKSLPQGGKPAFRPAFLHTFPRFRIEFLFILFQCSPSFLSRFLPETKQLRFFLARIRRAVVLASCEQKSSVPCRCRFSTVFCSTFPSIFRPISSSP